MYPNAPDWTTPSDSDAWWIVGFTDAAGNPASSICSTGGRAFVDVLQQALGVTVDGRWGANTSAALAAAVQRIGGSATLVSAVQQEAAARQPSVSSLKAAAFLLHSGQSFGGGTPTNISEAQVAVSPQAIPPTWNTAAPQGPGGDILPSCASPQSQAPANQPTAVPDQSAAVPFDQTQPANIPDASGGTGGTTGLVPGGNQGPLFPTVTSVATTPAAPGGPPSYTGLVVFGVAAAAIGTVAWLALRKSPGGVAAAKPLPVSPAKPKPVLRSARPNPFNSQRHELRHKSHTIRMVGRQALGEVESVRRGYHLSEPQSQAIQTAVREGFQLTSRPAGATSTHFWHIKMLAPAGAAKATGHRLERSGFRELPVGEFNLLLRKK